MTHAVGAHGPGHTRDDRCASRAHDASLECFWWGTGYHQHAHALSTGMIAGTYFAPCVIALAAVGHTNEAMARTAPPHLVEAHAGEHARPVGVREGASQRVQRRDVAGPAKAQHAQLAHLLARVQGRCDKQYAVYRVRCNPNPVNPNPMFCSPQRSPVPSPASACCTRGVELPTLWEAKDMVAHESA